MQWFTTVSHSTLPICTWTPSWASLSAQQLKSHRTLWAGMLWTSGDEDGSYLLPWPQAVLLESAAYLCHWVSHCVFVCCRGEWPWDDITTTLTGNSILTKTLVKPNISKRSCKPSKWTYIFWIKRSLGGITISFSRDFSSMFGFWTNQTN